MYIRTHTRVKFSTLIRLYLIVSSRSDNDIADASIDFLILFIRRGCALSLPPPDVDIIRREEIGITRARSYDLLYGVSKSALSMSRIRWRLSASCEFPLIIGRRFATRANLCLELPELLKGRVRSMQRSTTCTITRN